MKTKQATKILFVFMLLTNLVMGVSLINIIQQYQDENRQLTLNIGYRDARISTLIGDHRQLVDRLTLNIDTLNKRINNLENEAQPVNLQDLLRPGANAGLISGVQDIRIIDKQNSVLYEGSKTWDSQYKQYYDYEITMIGLEKRDPGKVLCAAPTGSVCRVRDVYIVIQINK